MAVGADRQSTATSANARWTCGSNVVSIGQTISPDRRKPKKQRHPAAHSIFALRGLGSLLQTALMARSIAGLMGRRRRVLNGVDFLAPFSTYSTLGMA